MFKRSNSVFVKALAMGSILASGGIATDGEDNKRENNLDVPLYKAKNYKDPTETTPETMGSGGQDIHISLIESNVRNILSLVDERAEARRKLLQRPIKVDLRGAPIRGVLPFDKVVNTLLADAKKYNVRIKLTLLNVTEKELDEIITNKNADFIDESEFDWTPETKLIDDMGAYDFYGMEDEKGEITNTSKDVDEEWIDDSVKLTADESDEEWITDPLWLTPGDPDEEWIDDPEGLLKHGPYAGLPRPRRAVARGRHMPILPDLMENFGQKAIVAPPKMGMVTPEAGSIVVVNPELSGWNMTLIKDVENNMGQNPHELGDTSNLTNHMSHSLVHIFCRENRVQA